MICCAMMLTHAYRYDLRTLRLMLIRVYCSLLAVPLYTTLVACVLLLELNSSRLMRDTCPGSHRLFTQRVMIYDLRTSRRDYRLLLGYLTLASHLPTDCRVYDSS